MVRYWKVYCMEEYYPGHWHHWFKNQCVAVGWPPAYTRKSGESDRGWVEVRNALKEISKGDWVVAQLRNNRVGRIGEVVRKRVGDGQWDPLVPRSKAEPDGDMGRRVLVRWDLTAGPPSPDMVVELPPGNRLPAGVSRGTIRELHATEFGFVVRAMKNEANWVPVGGQFRFEQSLSDYISAYPHKLEDGLQPYPSKRIREHVFPDRSRSDVLLIDRTGKPVVVECKQRDPKVGHVRQIRKYMKDLKRETGKEPRGILVHGGARMIRGDVRRAANEKPRIEIVQYSLSLEFTSCK